MPKRTYNQITTTTKKFVPRKKRRVIRRRKPMIARGPFPVTKVAKMRLCLPLQTFACTNGALSKLGVYANFPYSGTNYAYGWNQWSALYNNYAVLGSKCTVYHTGYTNLEGSNAMMGIYLSDDTTNFTTWTTMIEAKRGTYRQISENLNSRTTSAVSKYSAKKHYNIKDVKDNIDRIGSTMTAAPQDSAFFNVWFQPINQTSGATYYANIIVDYIVLFSEPKDVAAS